MNISIKDVEHVAALTRLNLSNEEKERYTRQFNVILEHIDRLQGLDLENIEPTTYVQPIKNIFREDVKIKSNSDVLHEVMKEAPDWENGLFKVPPVIE